ncbi:MAG TPA: acyl carrier protein [Gemmataceae bacterium]|jgi:acyl carrier protein|nr:acyl carrier protein [Gemmataceae bacterium]
MTPDRPAILQKLADLLTAESDRPTDDLSEATAIREGLGLDSVDLMSVVTRVEEAYRVRFSHQDLERVATVGDLVDLVVAKAAA